ncbi:MAG: hypothetical protein WC794_05480 [Candidatus Doudnabacteria bacterium]|jgi:heme A synthase
MNNIPWFSTFTLITETFVTVALLYLFYNAYYKNKFNFWLAGVTLGYEILFNISYMSYRALSHKDSATQPDSAFHIALAIFHGSFALLMFLLLLVFMFFAWKSYKKGVNFLQNHKKLTIIFIIAWLIAVISGFVFYYEAYFSPEEILTRQEILVK